MSATSLEKKQEASSFENTVLNILLVDDKEDNLISLESILDAPHRNIIKAQSGNEALKTAFETHREQTLAQGERLRTILRKHNAEGETHTDQAVQAMIRETEKMVDMIKRDDLRDAGLLASAQKLEHYEIAAYGSAATTSSSCTKVSKRKKTPTSC